MRMSGENLSEFASNAQSNASEISDKIKLENQEEELVEQRPKLNVRQRSRTTLMNIEKEESKDQNLVEGDKTFKRRESRHHTENILGYLNDFHSSSALLKATEHTPTIKTEQVKGDPEESSTSNLQEDHPTVELQVNFNESEKWDETKHAYKESKIRTGSYQLESPLQVIYFTCDFFF